MFFITIPYDVLLQALAKFIDSIGCQQGLPDSERQKGGVWML